MATPEQIQQNYADVSNAWGQFQWLINNALPVWRNNLHIYRNALNTRRRLR